MNIKFHTELVPNPWLTYAAEPRGPQANQPVLKCNLQPKAAHSQSPSGESTPRRFKSETDYQLVNLERSRNCLQARS